MSAQVNQERKDLQKTKVPKKDPKRTKDGRVKRVVLPKPVNKSKQ
jgi:hypothetical protein